MCIHGQGFTPMVKCPPTTRWASPTTPSTRSSRKPRPANTSREQSSLTSSPPWSTRWPGGEWTLIVFFWGENWNLPEPVPPREHDHGEGGRRQQLCSGSLYYWKGAGGHFSYYNLYLCSIIYDLSLFSGSLYYWKGAGTWFWFCNILFGHEL